MIWEICETWTNIYHARMDTRKVFSMSQPSWFLSCVNCPGNTFIKYMGPGFSVKTRFGIAVFIRAVENQRPPSLPSFNNLLVHDTDPMCSTLLKSFTYTSAKTHKVTGFLRRLSFIKGQRKFPLLKTSRCHFSLLACKGLFVDGKYITRRSCSWQIPNLLRCWPPVDSTSSEKNWFFDGFPQ